MAYDLLLKQSFHLMDVSIGLSAEPKSAFVGRLVEVDGFRMSCLSLVPLRPELLEQACERSGQSLKLRRRTGYDHSYYFISTFMEEHLRHHAVALAA